MTDRHTASSINDDALTELYDQRNRAAMDAVNLESALHVLRFSLDRFAAARFNPAPEFLRDLIDRITDDPGDPCDRDEQYARAETAEATAADLRRRLEGTHTRLLALATDLEHPKHRGEYGIPHPVVAVMIREALAGEAPAATEATGTRSGLQRWADALLHRGPGYDLSPPFIDRPFRSHRTTPPLHACTYGERCPNCRD